MQFSEIIGQSVVKQQLAQAVRSERMPHAAIFLGPRGCGSLPLAIAFAQFVNCENPTETDSCGECRTCTRIHKGIHPDVHYSYPTVGSKAISTHFLKEWREALAANPYMDVNQWLQLLGAENKQGNITRDECVDIVKKMSFKNYEAPYKVLIIWLPEYLAKEGNRLLKLIEEPPPQTLFILVAENQELILNTILSRCQITKINKLTDEDIIGGLATKGINEEDARRIAFLSDGNYNEALKQLNHETNDHATLFLKWFRVGYKGNGIEMVNWVDAFAKLGRENQKQLLNYALYFMREFMVVKMTGNAQVRLQGDELTTAQNMTKVIEFDQIEKITKLLNDSYYYIERNANPKALFLDASIQLHKILRNKIPNSK